MCSFVVYLILCVSRLCIVGIAVGILFVKKNVFRTFSIAEVMLLGIASSPFFIASIVYLLGLVFVGWSTLFFYFTPLAIALFWIFYSGNYKIAIKATCDIYNFLKQQIRSVKKLVFLDVATVIGIGTIFNFLVRYAQLCQGAWTDASSHKQFCLLVLSSFIQKPFPSNTVTCVFYAFLVLIASSHIICFVRNRRFFEKNFFLVLLLAFIVCLLQVIFSKFELMTAPIWDDFEQYKIEATFFSEDKNSYQIDNYPRDKEDKYFRTFHFPLWIAYLADAKMQANIFGINDDICFSHYILLVYFCFVGALLVCVFFLFHKSATTAILCVFLFFLHPNTGKSLLEQNRDSFAILGLLLHVVHGIVLGSSIEKNRIGWADCFFVGLFVCFAVNGSTATMAHAILFSSVLAVFLFFKTEKFCDTLKYSVCAHGLLGVFSLIFIKWGVPESHNCFTRGCWISLITSVNASFLVKLVGIIGLCLLLKKLEIKKKKLFLIITFLTCLGVFLSVCVFNKYKLNAIFLHERLSSYIFAFFCLLSCVYFTYEPWERYLVYQRLLAGVVGFIYFICFLGMYNSSNCMLTHEQQLQLKELYINTSSEDWVIGKPKLFRYLQKHRDLKVFNTVVKDRWLQGTINIDNVVFHRCQRDRIELFSRDNSFEKIVFGEYVLFHKRKR